MTIHVFDRQTVERGVPLQRPHVLISIFDPDSRRGPAKLPPDPNRVDVLTLGFHDALLPSDPENEGVPPGIHLLSDEQVRSVVDFVERHRNGVSAIVVHCNQGLSRSPAVAAAIAEHLGEESNGFWKRHSPNATVYQLLKRAFAERQTGNS
jgi:predicted protein tyrosine phosphatase